ncbi:MAG: class I SAM-dependent methyltransferase [Acidobacteria bacterium]|nr:class I SAM-dependent methyltransferase [Acidobacteriota bacterium]
MNGLYHQGLQLFNGVYDQISNHRVAAGMQNLFSGLSQLKREADTDEWHAFANRDWKSHPVKALVHQDPLTRRAFEKPRGYAGDAELIDFIYGLRDLPQTSSIGAAIYGHMFEATAAKAVRARRDILAERLDAIADQVEQPRVLAIACGHLREAQKSRAVAEGRIGEFIGLDQDRISLALLEQEQCGFGVKPVHGSVRSILKGETSFADFDFVYSTGLYDYLPQSVATDLTTKLFEMLKPGGQLLVANFLTGVPDVGYMETFMGWPLIYRTDEELADVASGIDQTQIADCRTFRDPLQNIVFLEVKRDR